MAFDYDSPDIAPDALAEIVGEISGGGLKPLSPEEQEQRQLEHWRFLEQCKERAEQQRLESEHRRAEAAEAEWVEAERQAAIARAEAKERSRLEYLGRTSRQTRDRTLTTLLDHAISQRQFRQAAVRSAAQASARQRLNKALDAAMELSNPTPPPEPTTVFVEQDDGSADFGSRNAPCPLSTTARVLS